MGRLEPRGLLALVPGTETVVGSVEQAEQGKPVEREPAERAPVEKQEPAEREVRLELAEGRMGFG